MTIAERRMDRMVDSVAHVFGWFAGGPWERHHLEPGVADFTFGNPQEMPLPGLVDALQRNAVPATRTGSRTSSARTSRGAWWPPRSGGGPASPSGRRTSR